MYVLYRFVNYCLCTPPLPFWNQADPPTQVLCGLCLSDAYYSPPANKSKVFQKVNHCFLHPTAPIFNQADPTGPTQIDMTKNTTCYKNPISWFELGGEHSYVWLCFYIWFTCVLCVWYSPPANKSIVFNFPIHHASLTLLGFASTSLRAERCLNLIDLYVRVGPYVREDIAWNEARRICRGVE